MTHWPGPTGPNDQQGPPAQPAGTYRQPWANPPATTQPPAGTPEAYQQTWNQAPAAGPSAQPWTQQPTPGAPPPGWPPQPAPPTFTAPTPPKSRKRLVIGALIVVALVVAGVVGYRVSTGEGIAGIGGKSNLSAKDTVQQYLQALADGDAAKALSFGSSQPASTDLLTDDILAKQNAKMAITDIRILDEDTTTESIGMSRVHVAVNFGSVVSDVQIPLKKDGDGTWKLQNAAVKLDPPPGGDSIKAYDTVTVFNRTFNKGSLYVFPGYLEVGSSNRYLDVTSEPILLQGLASYGSSSYLDAKVKLNDDGRQAVTDELTDAFANCSRSGQLKPVNCPVRLSAYDSVNAIDGTASWGKADLSEVTIGDLSPYNMTVSLSGKATLPLSYQTTDGGTQRGTVSAYIGGDADMTTTPPTLNLR
jgi:hypothetical protein